MAHDHQSGPGFGSGLIIGSLLGALAGVLLAPKPGDETRAQVLEKTAVLRERAEELAGEARGLIREAVEEGRAVASRLRKNNGDVRSEPNPFEPVER